MRTRAWGTTIVGALIVAACGPPTVLAPAPAPSASVVATAPSLPPEFSELARAEQLEIADAWSGLGPIHGVSILLQRNGDQFTFQAKFSRYETTEHVFDRYVFNHGGTGCTCPIDQSCPCENPAFTRYAGTVAVGPVEAFLAEAARHALSPSVPTPRGNWTDDFPRGHVAVWVHRDGAPIHLSFLDQHRYWRVNALYLAVDPGPASEPLGPLHSPQPELDGKYQSMLVAIGVRQWLTAAYGADGD